MTSIIKPDPVFVQTVVSGIIDANGTSVTLETEPERVICPTCSGTDPFCPACEGSKFITTTIPLTVTGTVKWKTLEKKKYRPEGQYMEGIGTVTIAYTEQLEQHMYKTRYAIVDGRRCTIDSWNLKGAPINRIYIVLKEVESLYGVRV